MATKIPDQLKQVAEQVYQGVETILTQELNSSVSNSTWEIKRPALLLASLLPINLQLHGVKTWDEMTIEQRSDDLFARAIQIWPRAI
jgi:hypothetical protein